jgi:hypothetical protein
MNRKLVFRAAIGLVILGVLSFGYRLLFPTHFDVAQWRSAASPAELVARRQMIRDIDRLFENGSIRDRTTVMRYLGPPKIGDVHAGVDWMYDLGGRVNATAPEPHHWLEVTFNDAGDVTMHRVRQDSPDPGP